MTDRDVASPEKDAGHDHCLDSRNSSTPQWSNLVSNHTCTFSRGNNLSFAKLA